MVLGIVSPKNWRRMYGGCTERRSKENGLPLIKSVRLRSFSWDVFFYVLAVWRQPLRMNSWHLAVKPLPLQLCELSA